ncbi:MAG: ABC transporter permease [Gemmatimonadales bacterium]|nr:ABC transporter permease [Gemmatimonadales bacterium]
MAAWLARRLATAALTLAVALTALFALMRAAPGDPLAQLTDDRPLPPEARDALRRRYGLDQPLPRQFLAFAAGALRGDLGVSIQYGRPVRDLLAERLGATLLLAGTALLVNATLGIWLGARQAFAAGSAIDAALGTLATASYALPPFVLAVLAAGLFGVRLGWFPAAGARDPLLAADTGALALVLDRLRHLALPALVLSASTLGGTMRQQRAALLDALGRPFVRAARARGLDERRVRWGHAWRASLVPVLTHFGLWLPALVTGSVFVEAVFAWPGIGELAAAATAARDYPLVMGAALLAGAGVVLGSVVAEWAARLADPRGADAP